MKQFSTNWGCSWRWSWWCWWRWSLVRFHLQRIEWECTEEAEQLCLLKGRCRPPIPRPHPPLSHSHPRPPNPHCPVPIHICPICPCSRIYPHHCRCPASPHIYPLSCPCHPRSPLIYLTFIIAIIFHPPPPSWWWTSGARPSAATLREFTPSSETTPSSYAAHTASARYAGHLAKE